MKVNKNFDLPKPKVFLIRYDGSYLGGRAVIKAVSEKQAWRFLKAEYSSLEPLGECIIKTLSDNLGVLYNWDGDY